MNERDVAVVANLLGVKPDDTAGIIAEVARLKHAERNQGMPGERMPREWAEALNDIGVTLGLTGRIATPQLLQESVKEAKRELDLITMVLDLQPVPEHLPPLAARVRNITRPIMAPAHPPVGLSAIHDLQELYKALNVDRLSKAKERIELLQADSQEMSRVFKVLFPNDPASAPINRTLAREVERRLAIPPIPTLPSLDQIFSVLGEANLSDALKRIGALRKDSRAMSEIFKLVAPAGALPVKGNQTPQDVTVAAVKQKVEALDDIAQAVGLGKGAVPSFILNQVRGRVKVAEDPVELAKECVTQCLTAGYVQAAAIAKGLYALIKATKGGWKADQESAMDCIREQVTQGEPPEQWGDAARKAVKLMGGPHQLVTPRNLEALAREAQSRQYELKAIKDIVYEKPISAGPLTPLVAQLLNRLTRRQS